MANDLNRCEFIGRLGQDPETRFMPSGEPVVNMSIAVGEQWKDKSSGQKQERTTWVPVVVFGPLAKVCSDYLRKASRIYVAGKFKVRKWQDQSGQDRYTTEIVVNEMQMLDSRSDSAAQPAPQQQNQPSAQPAQTGGQSSGQGQPADDFDDDIPF